MYRHTRLVTRRRLVGGVALALVLFFLLFPAPFPLGKVDVVAYAVCHRIPERSFFVGGRQLPLCARCTGTFLGLLLTLVTLTAAGRARAGRLLPPRLLVVLGLFIGLWAFDGFNSYLAFYPNLPHLYEPQNWLRLTTGMLNGIALGSIVMMLSGLSLWSAPRPEPVLRGLGELAGLVLLGGLLIGLVLTAPPWLFYPLALTSTLGVVVMLTSVNTIIVLIVTHRENTLRRWRDVAWPALVALALSLVVVMGISAGRAALTSALDLPF